jgi:glycerophosphoryl diester phosphodiesterase
LSEPAPATSVTQPPTNPLRVGGPRDRLPPVLNIAHRGARAFAPENTIPAFAKAVDFGCPMFELDVHLSRDGELIVVHDDDLLRCSDVRAKFPGRAGYLVSDFTAAEIATLDAGSWYVAELEKPAAARQGFLRTLTDEEIRRYVSDADRALYRSGTVRHPTLEQALALAREKGLMVNVEIKTIPRLYPGIAPKVVALVRRLGMADRVIVSSFDHEQLAEVRRLDGGIPTAVLCSDRLANVSAYVRGLGADAYNPGCIGESDSVGVSKPGKEVDPATRRTFADLRAAGLGVNVWTENDPERMRALIAAGATGIFSDYPNRLREPLGASTSRSPAKEPAR